MGTFQFGEPHMEKHLFYPAHGSAQCCTVLQEWTVISGEWPYVHGSHMLFNCKFCQLFQVVLWPDSICLAWPFKGVPSTCSTRELLPAEKHKPIPHEITALKDQWNRSLFYFIFKKSHNIYIYFRDWYNLKCFKSPIKLLHSPLYYSSVKLIYHELGHAFLWFCSLLTPPLPSLRVPEPHLLGVKI